MEALRELADRAELQLENHPQTRNVYAAEPNANDKSWGHRIFSRGVGLSLMASGVPVKCLLMDSRVTSTLKSGEVDLILGFVSSLINLTVSKVVQQPAMKAAKGRLEHKQANADRLRR